MCGLAVDAMNYTVYCILVNVVVSGALCVMYVWMVSEVRVRLNPMFSKFAKSCDPICKALKLSPKGYVILCPPRSFHVSPCPPISFHVI